MERHQWLNALGLESSLGSKTQEAKQMTITVLNKRIRDALAAAPDGMTASELAFALDIGASQISRSLALMPDVYIDRWVQTRTKYAGVHCLAFVPDDCPHP